MKSVTLAVTLSLAAATPALAGPPWITVEVRPRGLEFLVVHTFHHGTANPMALRGTAYGLVNGRLVSAPLRFDALAEGNNSYALPPWGDKGIWVLNIATASDEHTGAGAVAMIDRAGNVTIRFPRTLTGVSRAATDAEVAAMLSALDEQRLPRVGRTSWGIGARMALPALLVVLLALVVARAVRAAARRQRAAQPSAA